MTIKTKKEGFKIRRPTPDYCVIDVVNADYVNELEAAMRRIEASFAEYRVAVRKGDPIGKAGFAFQNETDDILAGRAPAP